MSKWKAWFEAEGETELPLHLDARDITFVEMLEIIEGVEPVLVDWEVEER